MPGQQLLKPRRVSLVEQGAELGPHEDGVGVDGRRDPGRRIGDLVAEGAGVLQIAEGGQRHGQQRGEVDPAESPTGRPVGGDHTDPGKRRAARKARWMFLAWYVAISRSRPWWASHSAAAAAR